MSRTGASRVAADPVGHRGRRAAGGPAAWLASRLACGLGVVLAGAILGACATSVTVPGWVSRPQMPPTRIQLTYTTDALGPGGRMALTLPDGESFSGPYTQGWSTIETAQPQVPGLGGVFFDWGGPGSEGFMDDTPIPVYQTEWSSKGSATLSGDRGRSMSCRLRLKNPPARLAGGGEGRCLVSDGSAIDLRF